MLSGLPPLPPSSGRLTAARAARSPLARGTSTAAASPRRAPPPRSTGTACMRHGSRSRLRCAQCVGGGAAAHRRLRYRPRRAASCPSGLRCRAAASAPRTPPHGRHSRLHPRRRPEVLSSTQGSPHAASLSRIVRVDLFKGKHHPPPPCHAPEHPLFLVFSVLSAVCNTLPAMGVAETQLRLLVCG